MSIESFLASKPSVRPNGLVGFGGSPAPTAEPGDFPQADLERLANACLSGLDAAMAQIQAWQRRGHDLESIYLHGIAPCTRLLGWWWRCDTADFAQVTVASTQLQRLLQHLSAEFCAIGVERPLGLNLLLATEPRAQHTLGALMLSQFCQRAGWQVQMVVPDDVQDLLAPLQRDWFDALALSISTTRQLGALPSLIERVRAESPNPALRVIAGGPLVQSDPDAVRSLGVDLLGGDARETVKLLGEMVVPNKN